MSRAGSTALRGSAAGSHSAARSLHDLIDQREALRPLFRTTFETLASRFGPNELDSWSAGVLELVHVNAGPSCLIALWDVSRNQSISDGVATLAAAASAAANICRHAGAPAAAAAISAFPTAQRRFGVKALPRWWRAMDNLARHGPESAEAAAVRMDRILSQADIGRFEYFVATGLKAAAGDRKRRLAFFSLQDELARRLTEHAAGVGFAETERPAKTFVTALWGSPPLLRNRPYDSEQMQPRRSAIAGPLIQLPEFYAGVSDDTARALYKAAAAHAQAHLMLGGPRFAVGKLKPLQIVLVTLIEDARVEALAMSRFPGLRRLWAPYHQARPTGIKTVPILLARLARALFDPCYLDDDGFVGKGRGMFEAVASRLHDPSISREIGMLLGNDLGQMRVQFNAKTHVVEPIYRDDGLGLWDFGKDAPMSREALELTADAVRIEKQDDPERASLEPDAGATAEAAGRATPIAPDQRGAIVARYPEWDEAAGFERPEWTTVRELLAQPGDPCRIEAALEGAQALRGRIARLVRGARLGRTTRLKRQHEGYDLDFEAVLDAGIALRLGRQCDPRIFRSLSSKHRDLAVLILIDISESTRTRLASGRSILDVERLAVAVLAEAMDTLGDPFCLLAFASDGREDVKLTTVKTFDEPYDRACIGRLAGLSSGLSTRLGTALRHAGATIAQSRSFRKLVIVLTDGEPSDIDAASSDLIVDARRAVAGLKSRGIDGFGVVLDPGGTSSASAIFGRGNTMLMHRVEDLPRRLSEVYFRLARH